MSKPIFRIGWKYKDGFGRSSSGHATIKPEVFKDCPEVLVNAEKFNTLIKKVIMNTNRAYMCDPYGLSITIIEDLRGEINGKENN